MSPYVVVAAVVVIGLLLFVAAMGARTLLAPKAPTRAKLTTYESGVDPVPGAWSQSQIRYYLFALLFVMFDVEAVFIFPWAVDLDASRVHDLFATFTGWSDAEVEEVSSYVDQLGGVVTEHYLTVLYVCRAATRSE